MSVMQGIKLLFSNKNYVFLFISFNCLYGLYSAISSSITSFTTPYNYTASMNSVLCLTFLVAGIFFSFFIGTLLDKYQCYRKALIFLCCSSIASLSLNGLILPISSLLGQSLAMMFAGATVIPIMTVAYTYAGELTYPVPEIYSIGFLISISQVFGCILVSLIFIEFML